MAGQGGAKQGEGMQMSSFRETLHELTDWRTLVEIVFVPAALFGLICFVLSVVGG